MLIFSDLHMRESDEAACFATLDAIARIARPSEIVVCLGDFWHVRGAVPVGLLYRVSSFMRAWLISRTGPFIVVPGNHDQDDVMGSNGLDFLGLAPNVVVANSPMHVSGFDDDSAHMVAACIPYRKSVDEGRAFLAQAGHQFAFVHGEVRGAYMNDHVKSETGFDVDDFKYTAGLAFFGHWHRHQVLADGRIVYVGSPRQVSASEAGQAKGIVRVKVETGQWQHIPLDVGPRFFDGAEQALTTARVGDVVKVPHGSPHVAALAQRGVVVRQDPPPPEAGVVRVVVDDNARTSLREYSRAWVRSQAKSDVDGLLGVFEELWP